MAGSAASAKTKPRMVSKRNVDVEKDIVEKESSGVTMDIKRDWPVQSFLGTARPQPIEIHVGDRPYCVAKVLAESLGRQPCTQYHLGVGRQATSFLLRYR